MPILDIFWSMLMLFLFFAWAWLLVSVFIDIFGSDLSGWGKAGWTIFVLALPLLGVLIYLIVHGGDMQRRAMRDAAAVDRAQQDYIRSVAGAPSPADELAKLADLRNQGVITDGEFSAQKAALLG